MIAIIGWGAHATAARADDCRPVLDRNVTVEPGERRGCRLWVVGHRAAVARGGTVDGGIVVAYGSADVSGDVVGAVNVVNGDATIDGHVTGDVYATGIVRVGDTGRIGGNVTGASVQASPGATVDGDTTILSSGWTGASRSGGLGAVGFVGPLLGALVTALLAMLFGGLAAAFFPGAVDALRAQSTRGAAWIFIEIVMGLVVVAAVAAMIASLHAIPLVRWLVIAPVALAAGGALGIGRRFGARLAPRRGAPLQTGLGLAAITIAVSLIARSCPPLLFCTGGLLLALLSSWAIGVALLTAALRRTVPGSSSVQSASLPRPGGEPAAPTKPEPIADPGARPEDSPSVDAAAGAPVPEAGGTVELLAPDRATDPSPSIAAGGATEARIEPEDDRIEHDPSSRSPDADPGADDAFARALDPAAALDLRRIPGISPIYAHLLRSAGILTLEELAGATPSAIVAALEVPSVLSVDHDTAALWIAMARRRLGR
ncbi:MAG: DUF4332 domain-containing protein [Anaerolineae bacterium]